MLVNTCAVLAACACILGVSTITLTGSSGVDPNPESSDLSDPGSTGLSGKQAVKKLEPVSPNDGKMYDLKWNAQIGQSSQITQVVRLKLKTTWTDAKGTHEKPMEQITKIVYKESVLEVKDGRPVRVLRQIDKAQAYRKGDKQDDVQKSTLPIEGLKAELVEDANGKVRIVNVDDSAARSFNQQIRTESVWFDILPGRQVKIGDTWTPRMPASSTILPVSNGPVPESNVKMKLSQVYLDKASGIVIAEIDGKVRTAVQVGSEGETATAVADIREEFIPSVGLSFLREMDGKINADLTMDIQGTPRKVKAIGELQAIEERGLVLDDGADSSNLLSSIIGSK